MHLRKHRRQYGQPRRNFHDKRPNVSRSTFKHDLKNTIFWNRYDMFVGTRRIRFWQHGRKNFNNWPKDFSSKSENNRRNLHFFKQYYFSSNCSFEHLECSFENPGKNQSTKGWKIVPRSPKVMKRPLYNKKTFFLYNWFHRHVIGSVDSSTNFSRQEAEICLVNFRFSSVNI